MQKPLIYINPHTHEWILPFTNLCEFSEYGFGSDASTKGDVYSFGVVVLEMVARKRPTDEMFKGGLSLPNWVKSHYIGRMETVIDASLVTAVKNQTYEVKRMWEVAMGELVDVGLLCTQDSA